MTAESGQKSDCLRQLICPLYLSIQRTITLHQSMTATNLTRRTQHQYIFRGYLPREEDTKSLFLE